MCMGFIDIVDIMIDGDELVQIGGDEFDPGVFADVDETARITFAVLEAAMTEKERNNLQ